MFSKISSFFFFYFAIVGVYVIFLPKILSQIGYTSFEIGVIFAAAPLTRFIVPFVFTKFLRLDKDIFYLALMNIIFVGILFYISITNFWFFLIANVLFGASMGIILPFIESYSLNLLKKENYGKSRLFGSIGFIAISLILAKMLDDPFNGLHFFIFCIIFTVIFSLTIVAKNEAFKIPKSNAKSSINFLANVPFWMSIFLLQVSFGAFYNFFTIYETSFKISLEVVSYMWTFGVICETIFFYFQAPFLKHFSLPNLIKFACIATSIRWLILFLFPTSVYLTFFSQSFHAISFALLHSAAFTYLHTLYKDKQLASQFYYGFSYGFGAFIGSLVAGITYGKYVYLISAFIAFFAFLSARKIGN